MDNVMKKKKKERCKVHKIGCEKSNLLFKWSYKNSNTTYK